MPRITCLHGHEIEIEPEQYGQKLACPACQLIMVVSPPRPGEPNVPKYEVKCDNGHVLRVKGKYLGTQIRCPQCQGMAWVTTDRLLCHTPQAAAPPVAPVPLSRRHMPIPPVVKSPTVTDASPVVAPVVATLEDIPVAEVDDTVDIPVAMADDDGDEVDDGKLTKAERRTMNLVDLGLAIFTGSVIGFYCLRMLTLVMLLLLALLLQVTKSSGILTVAEVVMWILAIAFLINTVVYLIGDILTVFTPPKTRALWWFVIGLISMMGITGWTAYWMIENRWTPRFDINPVFTSKWTALMMYIGQLAAVYLTWFFTMIGCWALGKFARKPMTRQRVILLCIFTLACEIVLGGVPLLLGVIPVGSTVGLWVIGIIYTMLTIGAGAFLSLQHMNVIADVRAVMVRKK